MNNDFHFLRDEIRDRRKHKTQQSKPEIIVKQHAHITGQRDAGVENLGREFAHPLGAVVDIGDCLCDHVSGVFLRKIGGGKVHEPRIQNLFHRTVGMIAEFADIKAFYESCGLHRRNRQNIPCRKHSHGTECFSVPENIQKPLRHMPFEPGTGQQTDIVDNAGDGNDQQCWPVGFEIRNDPRRIFDLLLFHDAFIAQSGQEISATSSMVWWSLRTSFVSAAR